MKNEKFSKFVLFLNQKTNYTFGTRIVHEVRFSLLIFKLKNEWPFGYTHFPHCLKKIQRDHFFLINWNTKSEIKLWFSFLYSSWDIKHQTKWFFDFKSNWTLKLVFKLRFSFLILIWKTENEKPNILKQISYETSYHLPYAITINKYKRIK